MPHAIHDYLAADHARLDRLLTDCLHGVDQRSYDEFRRGLLRHIGIEERILFPELRKHRGLTPLEEQLHRDHAALAALLVPPPTPAEIQQIAAILQAHNAIEEGDEGLYDLVERLAGDELPALIASVRDFPAVPPAPHSDTPLLRTTIEQLVRIAEEGRGGFRKV